MPPCISLTKRFSFDKSRKELEFSVVESIESVSYDLSIIIRFDVSFILQIRYR